MSPPEHDEYYGVLTRRNIRRVAWGRYEFDTWYGNAAYFSPHDYSHKTLGYGFAARLAADPSLRRKRHIEESPGVDPDEYWLDLLHVCEFCFKYTALPLEIRHHTSACAMNKQRPTTGKLVYRDDKSLYLIRRVRGFRHQLFCQNLSLFGKLFLDDKSVYYNVDNFDFYIVYGEDGGVYRPMGFFSKEVLSYDNDNNLACICVFPPYQRRGLGSLLIEFLYAAAKVTPGQLKSGPEFPLSPYGKLSYLRFWSKRIAYLLHLLHGRTFTLNSLADTTGFRKEDILFCLQYMKLIRRDSKGFVVALDELAQWCDTNGVDPTQNKCMLNPASLLV